MRPNSLLLAATLLSACNANNSSGKKQEEQKPNIIVIYMDDLGYGDVSAYGAKTIQTPNIDFLANNGLRFTNGHASSATCSPSRYALLTGSYPWKEKSVSILPGTAPLVIDTSMITLPKMLKQMGYFTGVVGKWHLGLGTGNVDWNQHISPGPNEVGFDYSYIMAATQDRVPTVYIENGDVVGLDPNDPIEVRWNENFEGQPTGKDNPELLSMMWQHGHNASIVNGIPRIGFMKGGEKAKWSDVDMADHFLEKAQSYVKAHKDEPFFLYYAMQQPHVPRTPNPRFVGATSMGPRGDVIAEADWCIGEFISTLEELELLENTLIIFSSDNGPVLNDGYYDDAVEKLGNHKPSGPLRGGKYSLYEAGTRVPFICYWKGTIEAGVSDALICHIDLLSSLSQMLGSDAKSADGESLADVFLGKEEKGRDYLILEASSKTALREGDWLMIPPYKGQKVSDNTNIELGNSSEYQLYNLANDLGEQNNLAESNPEKLEEMIAKYREVRGGDIQNTQEPKQK
jgi:arylsulfatase A-like enzyme